MIIYSPEFRKEDGTRVIVHLYIHEEYGKIKFRIYDIRYCEPRKRTWKSFEASFRDNFDYRQLSRDDRRKYEIEKYISFVGKEKLEEAIMRAWESLKPDVNEILHVEDW